MTERPSYHRYDKETKQKAIAEYHAGHSPKEVYEKYGIPKRTFFSWLNAAKTTSNKGAECRDADFTDDSRACACDKKESKVKVIPKKDYAKWYASSYDIDKARLQEAAINGYCEGIEITDGLLKEVSEIEDVTDRIYCTLAVLKERRCIQDRIIKAFADITVSSNEYEVMFGKLFNITPKKGNEEVEQ